MLWCFTPVPTLSQFADGTVNGQLEQLPKAAGVTESERMQILY